ncbi:MAG: VCBS repeat-containing protein, partial [bacterium]
MIAVDVNNDQELDLVVTDFNAGTVSVLLGSGAGDFTPLDPQTSATTPAQIVAADFDKDEMIDLVVSETESEFVYFMKGHGDGTFDAPITSMSGHDPAGLV